MARGTPGQVIWLVLLAVTAAAQQPKLTRQQQIVIKSITPQSLQATVAFLSSDLLEGRSTPSRGLDIAAAYIASQFQLARLEPIGDDGYYQTVDLEDLGPRGLQIRRSLGPGAPTKMRNVAGLLRGSDPKLRDTYVLLTSHYDHRSMAETGDDRIFNGANDDASGTTGVVEAAKALASLPVRPKRSILFVTFFGEERGLLGSRYYGQHPLVPLQKTIANLNLEQIGRTDAGDSPQVKTASITGFDFSGIPGIFVTTGKLIGVKVYKNPEFSDRFFRSSDNLALAELGIPAHTLCVSFEFPDYHKVTDTWDKIDYNNMAAVNRLVALGLLELANATAPPNWNAAYAPAQKYAEAGKKLYAPHSCAVKKSGAGFSLQRGH